MITKIYLALVSVTYLALALWCTFQPQTTSRKVGFELIGGSGRSEFITVYGGLEFALVLIFLLGCFRADSLSFSLLACVLVHGSLVLFRSLSFGMASGIDPFTYKLAAGEWIIFLIGLAIMWFNGRASAGDMS